MEETEQWDPLRICIETSGSKLFLRIELTIELSRYGEITKLVG